MGYLKLYFNINYVKILERPLTFTLVGLRKIFLEVHSFLKIQAFEV